MVRTVKTYDPPMVITEGQSGLIYLDLRVMTRQGEVVIDFGGFKDLLNYNDSLTVESPAGSFNLKMRATLNNEKLLKQLHPGMVVEVYACRNDDPLKDVEAFVAQNPEENPPVFEPGEGEGSGLHPDYAPVEGKLADPPEPDWEDYLDKAPYLLMRGVTTSYGRSSAVIGGGGGETTLTLSGETYGKVYRDAQILTDLHSPTAIGKSMEVRVQSADVRGVVAQYYGILRHWVEEFWGEDTGWEARTRPIPIPPDVFARVGNEGSVWSALQYLSIQGIFHQFVDHTGAICWEKLPYSGKCQTVLDQEYLKWSDTPLRNWEDLPLVEVPSWMIQSWADRLSCDRLANYVRAQMMGQLGEGGSDTLMDAGQVFNLGSIRQYGGPKKLEIQIPARHSQSGYFSAEDEEREKRISTFMDLVALEVIRWYDRPQQRIILSVRGEPGWRINTRISITENWHNTKAKPGEYLVLSRAHSIDVSSGTWTTQIDAVRDRRTRYLGAGLTVDRGRLGRLGEDQPAWATDALAELDRMAGVESDPEELKEFVSPIEPDEYWWFERDSEKLIVKIGDDTAYNELIAPWLPEECKRGADDENDAASPAAEGVTDDD